MKLLIADSDPLILKNFSVYLSLQNDITIVGLTADGTNMMDMCKVTNPDVVLLDYRLDCVATTRQIKAHCPNTQVIILALYVSVK